MMMMMMAIKLLLVFLLLVVGTTIATSTGTTKAGSRILHGEKNGIVSGYHDRSPVLFFHINHLLPSTHTTTPAPVYFLQSLAALCSPVAIFIGAGSTIGSSSSSSSSASSSSCHNTGTTTTIQQRWKQWIDQCQQGAGADDVNVDGCHCRHWYIIDSRFTSDDDGHPHVASLFHTLSTPATGSDVLPYTYHQHRWFVYLTSTQQLLDGSLLDSLRSMTLSQWSGTLSPAVLATGRQRQLLDSYVQWNHNDDAKDSNGDTGDNGEGTSFSTTKIPMPHFPLWSHRLWTTMPPSSSHHYTLHHHHHGQLSSHTRYYLRGHYSYLVASRNVLWQSAIDRDRTGEKVSATATSSPSVNDGFSQIALESVLELAERRQRLQRRRMRRRRQRQREQDDRTYDDHNGEVPEEQQHRQRHRKRSSRRRGAGRRRGTPHRKGGRMKKSNRRHKSSSSSKSERTTAATVAPVRASFTRHYYTPHWRKLLRNIVAHRPCQITAFLQHAVESSRYAMQHLRSPLSPLQSSATSASQLQQQQQHPLPHPSSSAQLTTHMVAVMPRYIHVVDLTASAHIIRVIDDNDDDERGDSTSTSNDGGNDTRSCIQNPSSSVYQWRECVGSSQHKSGGNSCQRPPSSNCYYLSPHLLLNVAVAQYHTDGTRLLRSLSSALSSSSLTSVASRPLEVVRGPPVVCHGPALAKDIFRCSSSTLRQRVGQGMEFLTHTVLSLSLYDEQHVSDLHYHHTHVRHRHWSRPVLITFVNDAWVGFMMSWMCNYRRISVKSAISDRIIIIATDEWAFARLYNNALGIRVVFIDFDRNNDCEACRGSLSSQSTHFTSYWYYQVKRIAVIQALVQLGVPFALFSPMTIWLRSAVVDVERVVWRRRNVHGGRDGNERGGSSGEGTSEEKGSNKYHTWDIAGMSYDFSDATTTTTTTTTATSSSTTTTTTAGAITCTLCIFYPSTSTREVVRDWLLLTTRRWRLAIGIAAASGVDGTTSDQHSSSASDVHNLRTVNAILNLAIRRHHRSYHRNGNGNDNGAKGVGVMVLSSKRYVSGQWYDTGTCGDGEKVRQWIHSAMNDEDHGDGGIVLIANDWLSPRVSTSLSSATKTKTNIGDDEWGGSDEETLHLLYQRLHYRRHWFIAGVQPVAQRTATKRMAVAWREFAADTPPEDEMRMSGTTPCHGQTLRRWYHRNWHESIDDDGYVVDENVYRGRLRQQVAQDWWREQMYQRRQQRQAKNTKRVSSTSSPSSTPLVSLDMEVERARQNDALSQPNLVPTADRAQKVLRDEIMGVDAPRDEHGNVIPLAPVLEHFPPITAMSSPQQCWNVKFRLKIESQKNTESSSNSSSRGGIDDSSSDNDSKAKESTMENPSTVSKVQEVVSVTPAEAKVHHRHRSKKRKHSPKHRQQQHKYHSRRSPKPKEYVPPPPLPSPPATAPVPAAQDTPAVSDGIDMTGMAQAVAETANHDTAKPSPSSLSS